MNESNPRRTMILINLRNELAAVLATHGELAPPAFRDAMGRMTNEVLGLLAQRPQAPLSTMFVFADELAKEFAVRTDAIDGEALRQHLHHTIARTLGWKMPPSTSRAVTPSTGMRLLH